MPDFNDTRVDWTCHPDVSILLNDGNVTAGTYFISECDHTVEHTCLESGWDVPGSKNPWEISFYLSKVYSYILSYRHYKHGNVFSLPRVGPGCSRFEESLKIVLGTYLS
jgi:hypothetical protein